MTMCCFHLSSTHWTIITECAHFYYIVKVLKHDGSYYTLGASREFRGSSNCSLSLSLNCLKRIPSIYINQIIALSLFDQSVKQNKARK